MGTEKKERSKIFHLLLFFTIMIAIVVLSILFILKVSILKNPELLPREELDIREIYLKSRDIFLNKVNNNTLNRTNKMVNEALLNKYLTFRDCFINLGSSRYNKRIFYLYRKECGADLKNELQDNIKLKIIKKYNDVFCEIWVSEITKYYNLNTSKSEGEFIAQYEYCKFLFEFAIDRINISNIKTSDIRYFYSAVLENSSEKCKFISRTSLKKQCLLEIGN